MATPQQLEQHGPPDVSGAGASRRRLSWGAYVSQKKEEIFLVNSMAFTVLLWIKLDHGHEVVLAWASVIAPLLCSNLVGMFCALRRVRSITRNYTGLDYEWWPQSSKNAVLVCAETLLEEWVSLVFKLVLIEGGPSLSYMIKFTPLWLAICANMVLFYLRRPNKGVLVKPRYIFALMVAVKLDGWNDFPWHFQFAPLWFLLSIVLCFVFMFAMSVNQRRLTVHKRKAFMTAAVAILISLFLAAVMLIELAKYLEGMVDEFAAVAKLALLMQAVALCGLVVFGHYVRKDHQVQRQLSAAAAEREAKAQEIVLRFIQAPEDVFIRESANLFRKHVAKKSKAFGRRRSDRASSFASVASVTSPSCGGAASPAASPGSSLVKVTPRPEDFLDEQDFLSEEECVICCEEGADHILLECGHGNFCAPCSKELAKQNLCPICRQKISRIGRLAHKKLELQDALFVILDSVAVIKTVGEIEAAKLANGGVTPRSARSLSVRSLSAHSFDSLADVDLRSPLSPHSVRSVRSAFSVASSRTQSPAPFGDASDVEDIDMV